MNLSSPANPDALADAIVFWLLVLAWAVVVGLLLFVQLPRIVREARRLVKRVLALVNDTSMSARIAKAEADADRARSALDRLPALQERAAAAIATIRTTPLIPPAINDMLRRIRDEVRAFRSELN